MDPQEKNSAGMGGGQGCGNMPFRCGTSAKAVGTTLAVQKDASPTGG